MPGSLRKTRRKGGSPSGGTRLATTLDSIAEQLDDDQRVVERELIESARVSSVQRARARAQPGVLTPTHDAPLSATHTGVGHRHDLLCVAPAEASVAIKQIATFFRTLDDSLRGGGLTRPSLPSVNFRRKPPRESERIDVERTIAALVQWIREHAPVPWDPGVGSPFLVARGMAGAYLHDKGEAAKPLSKRAFEENFVNESTSDRVAVCRALDELVDALDSPLRRAVRALAQIAFGAAAPLREIARLIEEENPTVTRQLVWLPNGTRRVAPLASSDARFLPIPTALAVAVSELLVVANNLRRLDEVIRMKCLTTPRDHAPRGTLSERVLFLSVIKHLERGGFTPQETAALVDDGRGGTPKARAKRVYDNLGVGETKLRDRRTRHLRRLI